MVCVIMSSKHKKSSLEEMISSDEEEAKPSLKSGVILKTINNLKVVPLKNSLVENTKPVLGSDMFPEVYSNILLTAKKKSGKSVVIGNIVKKCAGKNTRVIAFCSTLNKDVAWIALKRYCKKHHIPFTGYQSIYEGKKNLLFEYLNKYQCQEERDMLDDSSEGEEMFSDMESNSDGSSSGSDSDDELELFTKGKGSRKNPLEKQHKVGADLSFLKKVESSLVPELPYQAPEIIFVFDDLSHELRDEAINKLVKTNRHIKCKVIMSCQWIHDLLPEAIKQVDYLLLFKGLDSKKLEKIIKDADLSINLPILKEVYDNATLEPFNFLYIDRFDHFRKNFDKQYIIPVS
jgi:hypothetical protein